ncbi:hypothetical protein DGG96_03520 [Legionella qingyii]|uniref:Uncharacterized protein n=1 Tax=Legionella qingyii TaxID=2184757 RepID=A0A317U8N8_9GAMM|nr:hypothetical protein DGG96_03520 [Legionella qingyii]
MCCTEVKADVGLVLYFGLVDIISLNRVVGLCKETLLSGVVLAFAMDFFVFLETVKILRLGSSEPTAVCVVIREVGEVG